MTDRKHLHNKVSYPKRIAIGYLFIIICGTILLSLPQASRNGQSIGLINALFTATSASCVTGLVVADTYTQWSLFGQIVILVLIQIGGLGFMSFMAMFSFFLKRKIGLGMRDMLRESVNTFSIGGIVKLYEKIILGTLFFEGTGAVILFLRFTKYMPLPQAVFCGIFHSVSAFCNAGFDIMGRFIPNSSFMLFTGDPTVCMTLSLLIIIGGIGFFVWDDISRNKLHFNKYMLHTKITLTVTAILLISGSALFLLFESGNTLIGMEPLQKLCVSFYQAVTPRTAGIAYVDIAALKPATKAMTIFLMFIGGASGSTAGGIKVTTLAVVLTAAFASIHNRKDNNIFGRRLEEDTVRRSSFVITINFTLAFIAAVVLMAQHPTLEPLDLLLEVFSAIGTVGLTANITPLLNSVSKMAIILLMYCGRVGSTSFALLFVDTRTRATISLPEEKINIG